MENKYFEKALIFKDKIINSIKEIFYSTGNELLIKIEDLNILQRENNVIESSTAIGYLLEEYVVSKLNIYLKAKNIGINLNKENQTTQNSSYDFSSNFQEDFFMVNLKANKLNNNAISAINKLYNDYVAINENLVKHFLIIKINYDIGFSKLGSETKKILIKDIDSFFLEELDFSETHFQDHRNWSKQMNLNSGRLIITNKFRIEKKLKREVIGYEKTKSFLKKIYYENIKD
ncbi:UpaP162 family type II restriction enzyme [Mycoplasmopsis hyopharyngis]|uniref:UpaP162 family type II restriction enzyme n=1 Tax=Mycoplasmopsis hyopharyngis TaxID=29558 RepID=UPI0038738E21